MARLISPILKAIQEEKIHEPNIVIDRKDSFAKKREKQCKNVSLSTLLPAFVSVKQCSFLGKDEKKYECLSKYFQPHNLYELGGKCWKNGLAIVFRSMYFGCQMPRSILIAIHLEFCLSCHTDGTSLASDFISKTNENALKNWHNYARTILHNLIITNTNTQSRHWKNMFCYPG